MVTVLCFARYRELLGFDRKDFPLAGPQTLGDLLADPGFADLPANALLAVNRAFVDRSHLLQDRDEVALMPPVSGG